jgi:hypothetical protein
MEKISKPWPSRLWQLAITSIEAVNRIAISESLANTVLSRRVLIRGEEIFVLLLERFELVVKTSTFGNAFWEVWEVWRRIHYIFRPLASTRFKVRMTTTATTIE